MEKTFDKGDQPDKDANVSKACAIESVDNKVRQTYKSTEKRFFLNPMVHLIILPPNMHTSGGRRHQNKVDTLKLYCTP